MSENFANDNVMSASASRARNVAYVGLSVAVIAICSWISIPIGPIPITLQMFAIPLLLAILPAKLSVAAIYSYVLIGAIGIPVFSGFRGGIGVLLGPTGGYIIGYLIGIVLGAVFFAAIRKMVRTDALLVFCQFVAGLVFTVCAYTVGCIQYSVVAGIPIEASFMASVVPFIIPDLLKIVVAVICAQPISKAIKSF